MKRRLSYLLIAVLIFVCEVLIATKLSSLKFLRENFGDFLVVILIYFAVKTVCDFRALPLAISVFLFACAVEISQYFHLADALGLRRGSILRILLGTTFSFYDIAMYLAGSITAYFIDSLCFRKRSAAKV
ncbi:MAG TPA: DUF2809 domain-containing protein [Blastocatellia bacterium]|nr:DUF2809 domain-containing protein [Blastocatellia bacterium]